MQVTERVDYTYQAVKGVEAGHVQEQTFDSRPCRFNPHHGRGLPIPFYVRGSHGGPRPCMKVLGHTSVSMSMVYAQMSDQEVRKDYQAVRGPGAVIAGPAASALRAGELQASALAWLKTNLPLDRA